MIQKINAFLFRGKIDEINSRICVCLRKDGAWDESSTFYISGEFKDAEDNLTYKHFNVMFANYTEDAEGNFTIEQFNPLTLEDKEQTVEGLYLQKKFFSTVEDGYQKLLNTNN
jgi:hypothetical protein